MMKRTIVFGIVGAMLLSFAPNVVRACGFHGLLGSGFSAQYPGSIDVAIALREAADTGVIDPASIQPKKADLFAYHRAVQRLQKLRDLMADNDVAKIPTFSLLLVESALWSRYARDDEKISVAVHTNGPRSGEAVVLTGEAVIAAIENGKMSWKQAIARNLIVIVPAQNTQNDRS